MPNEKEMLEICLENGASKADMIDVEKLPFEEQLRSYCEANQCDCYGKNYGCPPFVGETQDVIAEAKSYKKALVYQTIGQLSDSYDLDGMKDAMKKHSAVADVIKEKLTLNTEEHLDLRAGACLVCEQCAAIQGEPCKYPEKKTVSLEAYCINVTTLAKACDMKYMNGKNTVTYFGAFLVN